MQSLQKSVIRALSFIIPADKTRRVLRILRLVFVLKGHEYAVILGDLFDQIERMVHTAVKRVDTVAEDSLLGAGLRSAHGD